MTTMFKTKIDRQTHVLKCKPKYFQAQLDGVKNYEMRIMDRDFRVGDIIELTEVEEGVDALTTGRKLILTVVSILIGHENSGVREDFCILGTSHAVTPDMITAREITLT